MPLSAEEKLKRYQYYQLNAEKIRERNRAYHYTRRGLPVPPVKKYELRATRDHEGVLVQLAAFEAELKEREAALAEREAAVAAREAAIGKKPVKSSRAPAKVRVPSCPPVAPEPEWRPNPVIDMSAFK